MTTLERLRPTAGLIALITIISVVVVLGMGRPDLAAILLGFMVIWLSALEQFRELPPWRLALPTHAAASFRGGRPPVVVTRSRRGTNSISPWRHTRGASAALIEMNHSSSARRSLGALR